MSYREWPEEKMLRMYLQIYGMLEKQQAEYLLATACNSANPKRFVHRQIQIRKFFEPKPGYISTVPIGQPSDSTVDAFWLMAQYSESLNPLDTWLERDGIGFILNGKRYHAVKVPYEGEYTMQYVNREATENDSYIFIIEDLSTIDKMPLIKAEHCYAVIDRAKGNQYPKISYYTLEKASKEG